MTEQFVNTFQISSPKTKKTTCALCKYCTTPTQWLVYKSMVPKNLFTTNNIAAHGHVQQHLPKTSTDHNMDSDQGDCGEPLPQHMPPIYSWRICEQRWKHQCNERKEGRRTRSKNWERKGERRDRQQGTVRKGKGMSEGHSITCLLALAMATTTTSRGKGESNWQGQWKNNHKGNFLWCHLCSKAGRLRELHHLLVENIKQHNKRYLSDNSKSALHPSNQELSFNNQNYDMPISQMPRDQLPTYNAQEQCISKSYIRFIKGIYNNVYEHTWTNRLWHQPEWSSKKTTSCTSRTSTARSTIQAIGWSTSASWLTQEQLHRLRIETLPLISVLNHWMIQASNFR